MGPKILYSSPLQHFRHKPTSGNFTNLFNFLFHSSILSRMSRNVEFIQNVTFEKRNISITTIKKSYPHLRVLARAISEKKFTISSVKIFHYFCEKITIYNADLSQVDSSTTNISKLVPCRDNAVASDGKSTNITVKCTPRGNWTFGDLKCVCDKGFDFKNQGCSRK